MGARAADSGGMPISLLKQSFLSTTCLAGCAAGAAAAAVGRQACIWRPALPSQAAHPRAGKHGIFSCFNCNLLFNNVTAKFSRDHLLTATADISYRLSMDQSGPLTTRLHVDLCRQSSALCR